MSPTFAHTLDAICRWLEQTSLSQAIQVTNWVVPTVQTIHILAIAVVASSALMVDLRLVGIFGADQPLRRISARFMPFVWWPLCVLLATGAIMIIAEPPRSLKNPAFQLKMALLVAALIVTAVVQVLLRRDALSARPGAGAHPAVVTAAVVSMMLWTLIIFAGRWIAYYA